LVKYLLPRAKQFQRRASQRKARAIRRCGPAIQFFLINLH
jgi:hypothetical protein